jgi:hypothetical protein
MRKRLDVRREEGIDRQKSNTFAQNAQAIATVRSKLPVTTTIVSQVLAPIGYNVFEAHLSGPLVHPGRKDMQRIGHR